MIAMDVVDTLRHREDLVRRELNEEGREAELIARLREIYRNQGIEVPDRVLADGVKALKDSRFVYTPAPPGWKRTLLTLWAKRDSYGKAAAIALAALVGGWSAAITSWSPVPPSSPRSRPASRSLKRCPKPAAGARRCRWHRQRRGRQAEGGCAAGRGRARHPRSRPRGHDKDRRRACRTARRGRARVHADDRLAPGRELGRVAASARQSARRATTT